MECRAEKLFVFNFPRHRAAQKADAVEMASQLRKVREEAAEVATELSRRSYFDMAMETMDVMHACETLLVMLVGPDDDYLEKRKMEVIQKNADRGYYDG